MPVVSFVREKIAIEIESGGSILDAARQAGVIIESPCNGSGTCGKCQVWIDAADCVQIRHKGVHPVASGQTGQILVLSCETVVLGDIAVNIPGRSHQKIKILEQGVSFDVPLQPNVQKLFDLSHTTIYHGGTITGTEDGDTTKFLYGIVVDIGTTTLVASLVDLSAGEEIAATSALNPQSIHAQDVLSRIKFASTAEGLSVMHESFIDALQSMMAELCDRAGISCRNVYEIIFSGNTCMIHLAAGSDPAALGRYPYTPVFRGGMYLNAGTLGLRAAESCLIYLPPIISSYVGADITSGVLATQLHERRGNVLLIDVGTNGEMVLAREGRLLASSTAAGPAFEGMNISCGMRAASGAVERFVITGDGDIAVQTIDNADPSGICGSGLIDIVAELVLHGVIESSGRFCKPDSLAGSLRGRLTQSGHKTVFRIEERVCLTQKDVRQVQLAKSAIRSGVDMLFKNAGLAADDIDEVLIAGSFGYHLRPECLTTIGLLPRELGDRIEFVGNTSKTGGEAFLLNRDFRNEMADVVSRVEVVELANSENFQDIFVQNLGF